MAGVCLFAVRLVGVCSVAGGGCRLIAHATGLLLFNKTNHDRSLVLSLCFEYCTSPHTRLAGYKRIMNLFSHMKW